MLIALVKRLPLCQSSLHLARRLQCQAPHFPLQPTFSDHNQVVQIDTITNTSITVALRFLGLLRLEEEVNLISRGFLESLTIQSVNMSVS